jgi:nucleoside-diphosphate-sugar epimerase
MTGGTGFVGTYLTKKLIAEGHKVTILTQPLGSAALKLSGLAYATAIQPSRGNGRILSRNTM